MFNTILFGYLVFLTINQCNIWKKIIYSKLFFKNIFK